jgi:hypothetical protein
MQAHGISLEGHGPHGPCVPHGETNALDVLVLRNCSLCLYDECHSWQVWWQTGFYFFLFMGWGTMNKPGSLFSLLSVISITRRTATSHVPTANPTHWMALLLVIFPHQMHCWCTTHGLNAITSPGPVLSPFYSLSFSQVWRWTLLFFALQQKCASWRALSSGYKGRTHGPSHECASGGYGYGHPSVNCPVRFHFVSRPIWQWHIGLHSACWDSILDSCSSTSGITSQTQIWLILNKMTKLKKQTWALLPKLQVYASLSGCLTRNYFLFNLTLSSAWSTNCFQ